MTSSSSSPPSETAPGQDSVSINDQIPGSVGNTSPSNTLTPTANPSTDTGSQDDQVPGSTPVTTTLDPENNDSIEPNENTAESESTESIDSAQTGEPDSESNPDVQPSGPNVFQKLFAAFRSYKLHPSQLPRYYYTSLATQALIYLMLFISLQVEGNTSTTFVIACTVGGLILGVQLAHFGHYSTPKQFRHPYWHIEMLLLPCTVTLVTIAVFFIGNFTLLFRSSGQGVWETILGKLGGLEITLFVFSILFFVPLIYVNYLIIRIHKNQLSLLLPKPKPISIEIWNDDDWNLELEEHKLYWKHQLELLPKYFLISLGLQFGLLLDIFIVLQAQGASSTTLVFCMMLMFAMIVLLLRERINYRIPGGNPNTAWHLDVYFLPQIVMIVASFVFWVGNFTMMLHAIDLQAFEVLVPSLSPIGMTVFVLTILAFIPFLYVEWKIGQIHMFKLRKLAESLPRNMSTIPQTRSFWQRLTSSQNVLVNSATEATPDDDNSLESIDGEIVDENLV